MKMAFHSEQLGLRGTEIALYDYAYYAKKMFGIEPYIVSNIHANLESLEKFQQEFPVYLYNNFNEVPSLIDKHGIESIYYIKAGNYDGKIVQNAKNIVHAVFQMHQPHGNRYAYVSEWIANKMNWPHFVPHMVDIERHYHTNNLREYLNIPADAFVFGYHGGNGSFNIPWVQTTLNAVVKNRSDIYFVFLNVTPFGEAHDNIIFLEGTYDISVKISFINTCDAMLHARDGGESFGLSVAEFSLLNKPVFTTDWCSGGLCDAAHLAILQDKANIYTPDTIQHILMNIQQSDVRGMDWNMYSSYRPTNVMNKFYEEFIQGV